MKLSPIGASALLSESAATPMHNGVLCLIALPAAIDKGELLSRYSAMCEVRELRSPFNLVLKPPRLPVDLPGLAEQSGSDFSYHVRHLGLPWPGSTEQLLDLVGRLQAIPLNQSRPLWECCLIEGLEGSQFAIYCKTHQALVELPELVEELSRWFSTRQDIRRPPLPWAMPPKRRRDTEGEGPLRALFAMYGQALEQARTVPGLTRALTRLATQAMRRNPVATLPYSAPNSVLNVDVTGRREFAFARLDAEKLEKATRRHKVDERAVALSLVGGVLRNCLENARALPPRPLIARIEVTVKSVAGSRGRHTRSEVPVLVNLGTTEADPGERLKLVDQSLQDGIAALSRMTPAGMQSYSNMLMWPYHLTKLAGMSGRLRPMFNLVVTEYTAQKSPVYLDGLHLHGLYPIPALTDGHALHAGIRRVEKAVDLCVTACPDRVSGIRECLAALPAELDLLNS